MTKRELTERLVERGLVLFSDAQAIILWGGSVRRADISAFGDVDVLIVLPATTDFLPASAAVRLRENKDFFGEREITLDPFITDAKQLGERTMMFVGPDGEYQAHELIRYQIRNESEVIWGDRNIRDLVKPVSLQAALHDIIPKVLSHGVTRIRVEFPQAKDDLAFIAENKNTFFIIARTILALNERKLGTKEEAISYVTGRYPSSKRLGEVLLRLYRNETALPSDLPSRAEVEEFLFIAEASIRGFLTVDC